MFERYTDRARLVSVLAADAARSAGHTRIEVSHLLLGIIGAGGVGGAALAELGVELAGARAATRASTDRPGPAESARRPVLSAEAKSALASAPAEVRGESDSVSTGHILLALLREIGAQRLLRTLDVDVEYLRDRVVAKLGSSSEEVGVRPFLRDDATGVGAPVRVDGPYSDEFGETVFDSAALLAAAFGGPVSVPMVWPVHAETRNYVLLRSRESGRTRYMVRPRRADAPIVLGEHGSVFDRVRGSSRWIPLPELAAADGHVDVRRDAPHVILRNDVHVIRLVRFATVAEAITAARSVRLVHPSPHPSAPTMRA